VKEKKNYLSMVAEDLGLFSSSKIQASTDFFDWTCPDLDFPYIPEE
jgi:hypothetical protein